MKTASLAALLNDSEETTVIYLALDMIVPDPDQPRKEFSEEGLDGMAASMKVEGVIKPIEVRFHEDGVRYVIRDGERRWRAANRAGLDVIPALIKEIDEKRRLRRQLIANLHHENMSDLDEAVAIKALVDEEGSVSAVAPLIGKSIGYISKRLTVLNSPAAQELAQSGITGDIEILGSVAQVEKADPAAAAQLVKQAKAEGRLTRDKARDQAAQVKQRATAPKTREMKGADEDEGRSSPVKPSSGPVPLATGEALAIEVSISPESADADLFQACIDEHGAARLYPVGTSRTPTRCWVQFGDTDRKKKGDTNPRKAEFNCADLSLHWVTKYKLD
uniref:ParB/RepB/Spo0J family partition protein n=1 Tax=Sulfuriferula sp. GW6 TaxID=3345112 RepID=UPI0039F6E114